jgi:hypothetical protein
LNKRQLPNSRGVRVALGTGNNRVEGNRRASRNGRVRSSRTRKSLHRYEFAFFPTAVRRVGRYGEPLLDALANSLVACEADSWGAAVRAAAVSFKDPIEIPNGF